jgi:hypothetical protein
MEDLAPAPGRSPWRDIVRRLLPRVVLFVGVALVLAHTFRSRPRAVEVVYDYGNAWRGLVTARMVYRREGEVYYQVQFDYRQQPAAPVQPHTVKLLDGDYQVEITLTYAGEPPSGLQGRRAQTAGGATVVTLERPILVHGGGELHLYLAPPRDG